jgi:hypothetical protein
MNITWVQPLASIADFFLDEGVIVHCNLTNKFLSVGYVARNVTLPTSRLTLYSLAVFIECKACPLLFSP